MPSKSVIWAFGVGALSACASPTISIAACGDVTMTYQYPGDGSIGDRYWGSSWWRINSQNAPEASTQKAGQAEVSSPEEIFPLAKCSSSSFACVRTYQRVFAVPRGEWNSGARYVAQGASLSIEGCLRREVGECKTALFISDCRSTDGETRSRAAPGNILGKDCRESGWGQQIIFIADRERGIIGYEPADWWITGTDISRWDLSTLGVSASLLALVEPKGLLSCEISSTSRQWN